MLGAEEFGLNSNLSIMITCYHTQLAFVAIPIALQDASEKVQKVCRARRLLGGRRESFNRES